LAIITAILVITTKNPVSSVLFLIMLFFSIACYLVGIGLNFIGLSYLLIYVGAVSILFLFILMLINIRVSELISETQNSIPLVIIITILFANANYLYLAVGYIKETYTSSHND
jgi:NADH-ubiquinone oxidoreductase chain 6